MKRNTRISTFYPLKLNGSMHAVLEQQPDFTLGMMNRNLGIMLGTIKIQVLKLIPLVIRSPIPGIFTICMVMSGNGFRTVIIQIIMVPLLMVVRGNMEIAPPVYSGAVGGTTSPGTAGQLTASGTAPATTPAALASVF